MSKSKIESKIYQIRDKKVIIDTDLAELFKIELNSILQIVKKNKTQFPSLFCFRMTTLEWLQLRKKIEFQEIRKELPIAFTEQGVAMLTALMKNKAMLLTNVRIMKAFVANRNSSELIKSLLIKIEAIEAKQKQTELKVADVFNSLDRSRYVTQGIFFDGQLFDAHVFISGLIRKAKKSIIVIDNYVDETTLLLLTKRNKNVACEIHTRLTMCLKSDLIKCNLQYSEIVLKSNKLSHDRFLIIDDKILYHFGTSLKDLGKKCFAFSRMDKLLPDLKSNLLSRSKEGRLSYLNGIDL
ncbi:MAG: ORF6N domain-containing protein [Bacteroidota bacterium]